MPSQTSNSVLIITKNYPPQIGWIEQYSHILYKKLRLSGWIVYLVKTWPLPPKIKPPFSIFFNILRFINLFIKSFYFSIFYHSKIEVIWGMDWSLGWLVFFLGLITWKKTRLSMHGTDVVWSNQAYQKIMPFFWNHLDEIYSVSLNTSAEILKRGVLQKKITLFSIQSSDLDLPRLGLHDIAYWQKLFHLPSNKVLLFSIGRIISIKWFEWFLENVFQFLDKEKFYYIIAWDGPRLPACQKITKKYNLDNVLFTWAITDNVKKAFFFQSADYLIFPSEREGNPIVLMEADFYKIPAVLYPFPGSEKFVQNNYLLSSNPSDWLNFFNKAGAFFR